MHIKLHKLQHVCFCWDWTWIWISSHNVVQVVSCCCFQPSGVNLTPSMQLLHLTTTSRWRSVGLMRDWARSSLQALALVGKVVGGSNFEEDVVKVGLDRTWGKRSMPRFPWKMFLKCRHKKLLVVSTWNKFDSHINKKVGSAVTTSLFNSQIDRLTNRCMVLKLKYKFVCDIAMF